MSELSHLSEIVHKAKQVSNALTEITVSKRREQKFTIERIVRFIRWAHRHGQTIDIVIEGPKGAGKTTLALTIAAYVYSKRGNPNWEAALNSLFFKPTDAIMYLWRALAKGESVPCIIVDDAGAWIGKWTITAEKEAFFGVSDLSRLMTGGIIYTTVASLAKYLRMTAALFIRVRPLSKEERFRLAKNVNNEVIRSSLLNPTHTWSEARVYKPYWDVKYRFRVRRVGIMVYPARLPNKYYKLYTKKRLEYSAELLIRAALKSARSNPDNAVEILESARYQGEDIYQRLLALMCSDYKIRKNLELGGISCSNI